MKIRLAKKIMKFHPDFLYSNELLKMYWGVKWMEYDCFDRNDHRITKAISLTSKKKKLWAKKHLTSPRLSEE